MYALCTPWYFWYVCVVYSIYFCYVCVNQRQSRVVQKPIHHTYQHAAMPSTGCMQKALAFLGTSACLSTDIEF